MPDATGLELLAGEIADRHDGAVLDTVFRAPRATLVIDPAQNVPVLTILKERGFSFLSSLHGVDYFPEEPRLGVLYELLDMTALDRISVKARVHTEAPEIDSVCGLWPGAEFPEREVFDMFGVRFRDHPDLRRILMPEDYEGHPQRRDFPVGGEPILFTHNERTGPRWYE